MKCCYSILGLFLFIGQVLGQDATTVGSLNSYQTFNSLGFEWSITGDDNHNAECQVRYRLQGQSDWKDALPLFRIDIPGYANMLAGSILFLEQATTYEVELSLRDSDGGQSNQTVTITTRSIPQLPVNGHIYHVAPGSGGGTGSSSDPFLGIDAAQTVAQPGDIFLLASGHYGSARVRFTASGSNNQYIVWKAAPEAEPVFEGVRMIGDYIWLEGVTIQNVDYGLLTEYGQKPEGIVIKENRFNDCYYSIQLNHGGKNWLIVDNVIVGRIDDYSTGAMGGEGIELEHTSGHVIAHNSISNTADGISYPKSNCDIFGNEIFHVSDDGIELDFAEANTRVWSNRITNAYNNGISFQNTTGQPYGAPLYIIRNQVVVATEDAIKLRDNVDRVLLAHNTLVSWSGVVSNSTGKLVAFQSNNNLWISVSDRYVWEDTNSGTTADWRTFLDYDGFDWNDNYYAFKWANTRYTSLNAFQHATGLEPHGIHVQKDLIFEQFNVPEPPNLAPFQYMTLKSGCNAVDAGMVLPNINDGFTGSAPDLGAFEHSISVPHYGPRNNVRIKAKALLQGPSFYDTGEAMWKMVDGLPRNYSITQTPYNDLGWDSDATVVNPIPESAVDWVFIQLRSAPDLEPVLEKSAFISNQGVLLDLDGTEGISAGIAEGAYYITIKHRNHLSVTSATLVDVTVDGTTYDFSVAKDQALHGSGVVQLGSGVWAMAAGELNHDGYITTKDYVVSYNQMDDTGYIAGDFDFNTIIDGQDYQLWLMNAQLGLYKE